MKREANEAELRAYRANFQRTEKIRELERLLVDYQEAPQLWFRNRAEQIEALKTVGRELKALTRTEVPAEVVLDDTLWRTSERGSWADVVVTGRKPATLREALVLLHHEETEEKERLARWKKLNVSETTAGTSESRTDWHVKKELVKWKKMMETEEKADTTDYSREIHY